MYLRGTQAEKNHIFTTAEKICAAVQNIFRYEKCKIISVILTSDDKEKIAIKIAENNSNEAKAFSDSQAALIFGLMPFNEQNQMFPTDFYCGIAAGAAVYIAYAQQLSATISAAGSDAVLKAGLLPDEIKNITVVCIG